jgi:hypothetical protein
MIQQPTIHHYIMSYDSDNELWYHDVEMEREKFEDGATINTETGVASWGYLGDGQYAPNEQELNNQIVKAVEMMNALNGQTPAQRDTDMDIDYYIDYKEGE